MLGLPIIQDNQPPAPHLKILNFITSAKCLLPGKVTHSQVWALDVSIFGGLLFCPPHSDGDSSDQLIYINCSLSSLLCSSCLKTSSLTGADLEGRKEGLVGWEGRSRLH